MGQVELTDRFSDMSRFLLVERSRFTLANRAKAAVARANVAAQHECCGAIGPTFEDVGTARLLADRVQVQPLNQFQHVILVGRIAQTDL